ncbi:heme exporter protein CcmD [Niveispirillum fermenti]|uniref:heme exporter protein CcmD n=1 Tax=Niveispirillum fermenti TaxID=1233113 RepID=UPI003A860A15
MAEFFQMGGYAIYVWSSYGLALVVLGGLLGFSLAGLRRKERLLRMLEESLPRRRRRTDRQDAGGGDTP